MNFALFAAALNAPTSYCPDGVFSATIATARPVAPLGNTLAISSGHALLVAFFGTGHPAKPNPYELPQKFDDNAHPKYGTFWPTRYVDAARSGVTVGTTANTLSCSTSFLAAVLPAVGSPPSSVKPR